MLKKVSIITGVITVFLAILLITYGLLNPSERNSNFYFWVVNIFDIFFVITVVSGLIISIKSRFFAFVITFSFLLLIFFSSILLIVLRISLPFFVYLIFDFITLVVISGFIGNLIFNKS
ncbi:MAG: hypothetical protein ACP5Q5_00440 [Brevinematia bacterium]